MARQFTANYFFGTNIQTNNEVRQATLIDIDLERGNTAGEIVTETGGTREIFDGFIGFIPSDPVRLTGFERRFDDGEVSMTVRFNDGTSQSGVRGIVDFLSTGPFGEFSAAYLFDQQALASVGKTVADVESVFTFTYVDHNLSWADLGFTPAAVNVPTVATATYFSQSNITTGTGFGIGTLIDNDLLRDRDTGEAVDLGFGMRPGGGSLQGFGEGSQEIRANITFSDGTTLSGVDGLFTAFLIAGVGGADQLFLFDTAALAAVGKTITDVARVNSFTNTDHNLNWTDFGFSGTPITPEPPAPPPPPPPVLNVITGTAGNNVLVGTAGADLIRGGDGNDTLTGGAGPDTFVFGADARDGNRDRDVITDFGAGDSIVLELGAQLDFIERRGDSLYIQIQGGDSITLLNGGFGIPRTVEGIFTGPQAPTPPTPPAPMLNVITGTAGADRLTGTAGDDLIRGGDGNDRLTGRAGEDTFVFGADARDGNLDRDVITDFNAAEDTIVFEAGASIRLIEERGANLFIQLDGDRDSITVLNANRAIEANFVFVDDLFSA
jgi:hypothetical protein